MMTDKLKNGWIWPIPLLVLIYLSACRGNIAIPPGLSATPSRTPFQPAQATLTPTHTPVPTSTPTPLVLSGAGDISICGQEGDDQTAALLVDQPGYVFTLGDGSNEDGSLKQYERCFDPSWGQFKSRMIPVPGNHDYYTENASGYFAYFGERAGPADQGYYSLYLDDWQILVLNSNCTKIGGCGPSSEMVQWIEAELSQHPHLCTLAMWHQPRWSSGVHGNAIEMDTVWRLMVQYDVDLVLNGHEHSYERFAPMNENGEVDSQHGTRSFVVGTGGASLRGRGTVQPASEIFNSSTFGVLQLRLEQGGYSWQFMPVAADGFADAGQSSCH